MKAGLLVWLAVAPLGCKSSESSPAPARGRGGNLATFPVEYIPVEVKNVEYQWTGPGTLDAFEHVQVTSRVSGVVDKVGFREGQEVKKGEVLVVIDGERFRLSVNTAKAQLDKAKASEADNEAMVARREGASDKFPGLIPGEELATYQTRLLTARADTAVSQENLRISQLNLRDANVRAPIAGVIQTRTVQTGQYVNAGTVMATLLRTEPMLLRFSVSPQEAPRIRPSMSVEFKIREAREDFKATVTHVAGAADDESHMVQVTAIVEETDRKYWLRPGLFADVTVRIGEHRPAPMIPRTAIRANERGQMVFVIDDVADTGAGDAGARRERDPAAAPSGAASGRRGGPGGGGGAGAGGRGAGGGGPGGSGAGSGGPGAGGGPGGPAAKVREVLITLGMSTKDGWVEVRSGLKGGERLVVRGGESLSDGANVRPSPIELPAPGAGPEEAKPKLPEGMPSARPEPIPREPEAPAAPGAQP